MRKCRSYGMTSSIDNLFIIWPSSVTLTFNLHEQMSQIALLLLEKQLGQIILKSIYKCRSYCRTSSIFDHFIIWPSSVTLIFNLSWEMFQMALLLFKENNCAKLFWNSYINVEVMARTSSIYDHFIIWPSSVTLIFNLSWEMFQMALLLFKENNCAKLFWNSYINVEVMARTSSIYDHFIIWPSKVTLTFNLLKQTHQIALLLLKENNCAKLF